MGVCRERGDESDQHKPSVVVYKLNIHNQSGIHVHWKDQIWVIHSIAEEPEHQTVKQQIRQYFLSEGLDRTLYFSFIKFLLGTSI